MAKLPLAELINWSTTILLIIRPRNIIIMITINTLKNNKDKIQQILVQYHAENIRVFGSVARGDSTEESDVDFVVNFLPNASLFDQVGMTDELSLLLNCSVDVVSERALNKYVLPQVLNEAIPI